MSDELFLTEKLKKGYQDFENLCRRCGSCCGAHDGDPCANLVRDGEDRYLCRVYDRRFGIQKTMSGKVFTCIDIRELIKEKQLRPECGYHIRGRVSHYL
ncbi:MAG: hypothetical protein PHS37_01520 [Candidatus Omnitrophica bacterium]|nr:hypothetical protein [Candidatus Omnitrophota bacterium]